MSRFIFVATSRYIVRVVCGSSCFFLSRRRHTIFDCDWYSVVCFFFSSRRRHTRFDCDWSSDVCSSDLVELGASRYRGRRLGTWIYRKGFFALDTMSDLPKDVRARLAERVTIHVPEPERVTASQDGSRKLVFRLGDGSRISSVLMPDDDRLTLCVSTQVGCGFECRFCLTGVMGLERNLTAAEILGQVLAANRLCDGGQRVTHIVFMGMGEPLANYAALVQTLRILTDAKLGLGYSPRRITVSTVGLVPGIEKLGRENLKVNLAISLHAASDEVRSQLMPVNRSCSVER